MSAFGDVEPGLTIQFWIIARFFEAATLLLFPLFFRKAVKPLAVFFVFGLAFVLSMVAVYQQWVPVMYTVEGGLTLAKVISEYVIIGLLLLATYLVRLNRHKFNSSVYRLVVLSILLTIAAELCFTLYSSLSGELLLVGHLFKLASFWAVYVALVDSTLNQPFKSLSLSSDTFNALPDSIVAVSEHGVILHANETANRALGDFGVITGRHVHDVFHSPIISQEECPICQSIAQHNPTSYQEIEVYERWYAITLNPIRYEQKRNVVLHVTRDITQHKVTKTQYLTANRLYTVLRLTNQAIIRSKTKDDLLNSICDIAVKHGGFAMAWIGMVRGDQVIPVSSCGDDHGYLDDIQVKVDDSEYAKGPVGISAKTGQVAYVNNATSDPNFVPWRASALACNYHSLAVIPIMQKRRCIGVFAIYSQQENAFDTQILELLSTLGDDINSALNFIKTEEKRLHAEEKLQQLYLAIEQSKSAMAITNMLGKVEYVNPFFSRLTGFSERQVLSKDILKFYPCNEDDKHLFQQCWEHVLNGKDWRGEVRCYHKDGHSYWAIISVSPIIDAEDNISRVVWSSKDNTELHLANETISRLAYYDALTALPNRRLFHDRFKQALAAAKRHENKLALMYFDLDNFKIINDSWGHDFGDLFLKHVATSVKSCIREVDTVARLGGDEFCIIINDVKDDMDVMHVADSILKSLNQRTQLQGRDIHVTTSIGISVYPDDGEEVGELMKRADMAMYHAKELGKNNFQFYEPFLNANAQHRLQMELAMKEALKNGDFQIHYQPQFDIRSGIITGVEALIRWQDPTGKAVLPSDFIPLAEETSLIVELGNWVLFKSCSEYKALLDSGFPPVKMAINISASQFRQPDILVDVIDQALSQSGLPNELLQLELTETVLINNVDDTVATIERLKQKNISFAIDDFGTGYSSLSYLKQFPVDTIKIDRCFVHDIENNANSQAIIRAISVMAHELDLMVLAEGVETEAQLSFLVEHQCDFIQGFLSGKPMPAHTLMARYLEDLSPCPSLTPLALA